MNDELRIRGGDRGGEGGFGGYIFISICIYLTFSSTFSSTFPELINDFKKLCEMVGDRSKIKTNHAWMGPKRGGDTRVYTALALYNNMEAHTNVKF